MVSSTKKEKTINNVSSIKQGFKVRGAIFEPYLFHVVDFFLVHLKMPLTELKSLFVSVFFVKGVGLIMIFPQLNHVCSLRQPCWGLSTLPSYSRYHVWYVLYLKMVSYWWRNRVDGISVIYYHWKYCAQKKSVVEVAFLPEFKPQLQLVFPEYILW